MALLRSRGSSSSGGSNNNSGTNDNDDDCGAPAPVVQVKGSLINTGRGIIFKASGASKASIDDPVPPLVLFANGPLSYRYTLSHLALHYGRDMSRGSEHTIGGQQFSGEIQLYAYNSQLYSSWEEAANRAHGVVGIALLIQTSPDSKRANNQLKRLTHVLKNITSKGKQP